MPDQPVGASDDTYFDQYERPGSAGPAGNTGVAAGTPAPKARGPVPASQDTYFEDTYGAPQVTVPPAPPVKPDTAKQQVGKVALEAGKGLGGTFNKLASSVSTVAAAVPVMMDAAHSLIAGERRTPLQDWWFEHMVDPGLKEQATYDVDPTTGLPGKAANTVGSILGQISQMVLGGPEAETAGLIPQSTGQFLRGASEHALQTMKIPAVSDAVTTGRQVYQETGDADKAVRAAQAHYLITSATGLVPLSAPGSLPTRLATGAVSGAAFGEAGRQGLNAELPEEMRQPFSPEAMVENLATGAAMGGVMGPRLTRVPDMAREEAGSVMEHAQQIAAAEVAEKGGDALDQTVAATHVNAVLGGHHDAAAYEAHMEVKHAQAAQDLAEVQATQEQFNREAALNQAEKQNTPAATAEEGFGALEQRRARAAADEAAMRERDFSRARNQVGEQTIQNAEGEAAGGGVERPTLAEALPPEQLKALQDLKERRRLALDQPPAKPEPSKDQDFTPLPPQKASSKAAEAIAAMRKPAPKAPEVDEEDLENRALERTRIQEQFRREAEFNKNSNYQRLMLAKPGEHAALLEDMPVKEAQEHLDRLMSAPGINKPAQDALTAHINGEVDAAAHEAAPSPKNDLEQPTEAEHKAGNFQMGHTEVQGMPVTVEYPAGSERPAGEGSRTMAAHYGYFKGTMGADGMHVDTLVGKDPAQAKTAFIVDHLDPSGQWQQHKVLLGFPNRMQAMRAYRAAYPDNPLGPVSQVKVGELRDWLANGDTTKPYDQAGVNRLADTRPRFSAAENNASGESAASLEAINRGSRNLDLVKPDGSSEPVMGGVDQVDRQAPDGHLIVDRDSGEIVSRGKDLNALRANGLKNRYLATRGETPRAATAESVPQARVTPTEAYRAVKPITDRLGGQGVTVHTAANADSVPENVRASMAQRRYEPDRVRGAYDPETGEVHVFAGSHQTPEDVARTVLHEVVGHKGMRAVLGDEFGSTMHDIFRNASAPAKKWMSEYAARNSVDLMTKEGRMLAADEYSAHLAETPTEEPGFLGQIRDAVRAALRKLGFVREWSDDDIHALLKKSAANLSTEAARSGAAAKGPGLRFSVDHDKDAEQWPPDHPLAMESKFGTTMEQQANYNPGFVRRINDWAKDAWGKTLDTRLGAIQLRNLPDFLNTRTRGLMPSVKQFINMHDAMDGRRGQLMEPDYKLAVRWARWQKLNPTKGNALSELMNASTLAGVDPSKPFENRYDADSRAADPQKQAHDDAREGFHRRLQGLYNRLDSTGKELFQTVRDRYQEKRAIVMQGLENRINESGADEQTKKALMTELRKKFEAGRVQGPYFPLARFGDHWANAKDKDGNTVSFARFDSAAQKKAWMDEARSRGYQVDGGKRMDEKSLMERIDPDFVKRVMEITSGDKSTQDEIWQAYLRAMPEMSMRKQFIHRVGRLGFSGDTLRAFAYNAFHSAHQIARLEYGNKLDTVANNIKSEGRNVEAAAAAGGAGDPTGTDADYASGLAREFARRLDWIKNPRAGNLASALTKFGFGWYLGFAPATAFRISSQNMMIAQPLLAAHHGQFGATKELSRAMAQWALAKGNLGDTLRGDERKAFDEAGDRGIFSNTYAQTLAAGGNDRPIGVGFMDAFNRTAAYLFNAMEHKNRMSTFLASYRLGRTSGLDHDAAMDHAVNLTQMSHFDYTNANRPRWLQNDFAKVAMLFRQYAWGVTYAVGRNFRNATRMDAGVTPEERSTATKAFAGLMGRSMLFSGVTGLPMYWVAEHIMNAIFGDKDRPFDSTAAMKAQLSQHLGQTASDAITDGPMSAITGAALHNGASYNDLWYKSPQADLSTKDYITDAMGQFMGAVPSIATNAATGADQIAHGNIERGLEHFLPPEFAAAIKAVRYAREGVTNLQGEPVLDRDSLTNKDLFLQAIGFTPQKVADAYAQNTAIKNVEKEVKDRRQYLINRLTLASSMGDTPEIDQALTDITHFNETNADIPGVQIKAHGLISASRNHFKSQAEAINGVRLGKGMYGLEQQYGQQQEPSE